MPAAPDPPFAHLHVHSDYSVLDGACKVERLLDRVEQIGQSAVALTDHGVMSGAVELYRQATKRGITPVVGLEAYVVARPPRAPHPRAAQPPDAPRRDDRGLLQPHQALLGRLPRGLPPQAAHLARADGASRRRPHRALRMPVGRGVLEPRARRPRGGPHRARHPGPDLRARRRLRGDPARGPGDADRHQRAPAPAGGRHRAPDGRHLRRALPVPRGRRRPRGTAGHPDARPAEQPEPLQVPDEGVLPQDRRRDGRGAARLPRRAAGLAGDRRALRGARVAAGRRQAAPLPRARGGHPRAVPGPPVPRGHRPPLPAGGARRGRRAPALRARRSSARWASPATS